MADRLHAAVLLLRRWAAGLLLLALVLAAVPANAAEVIRDFATTIAVHEDLSVTITEQIEVVAEGASIRRGIFRDIPTVLETEGGRLQRSGLEVLSVTRDGQPEPYALESIRNGVRIRIGDADVLLATGPHTYTIRYTMERAARMFADYDELYWNATGNYWAFPIQRARAVVTLPPNAQIEELNVYTGGQGAVSEDARAEQISENEARFVTTAPLAPNEGMTVSVTFAKGILQAPQGLDAARYWFTDMMDIIVPAALVLLVLGYNAFAWGAVGRDPAKGVIIPRFYPPSGFSPALVHYVHRWGWRNSGWLAVSAALVSLAVRGLLTISEEKKKVITLTATGKRPERALPPGEEVLFDYVGALGTVTIDKDHGKELVKKRQQFINAIENENRNRYFRNHLVYVVLGGLLALGSLALMVFLGLVEPLILFGAGFVAVFATAIAGALRNFWQGPRIRHLFTIAIGGIVVFNFVGVALDSVDLSVIDFPVTAAVTIVMLTLVFGVLMRAPTVHGRKIMDEIDGFKMYLETAEKERLNFSDEPDMTVRRFEDILPYAMALGVEEPWSERFEADLARHAVADAPEHYAPYWYSGLGRGPSSLASTMGGMAAGLGAAMVAAQPAQASGSGAAGGGFSGGGGGGGGGGGW